MHRKNTLPKMRDSNRRVSHRKLTSEEEQRVLSFVHQTRFAKMSVRQIYATGIDEGVYLASISTIYRILRKYGETRERRRIAYHPPRVKPELVACEPDRVYSWDITKLAGPKKWEWFHLYVIIDIYSRYVVGWFLARNEDSMLAEELFTKVIVQRGIDSTRLTVHADNGSAMTSKTLARLFTDLQITRSHSRPHVSNDNPFSEAQFKTMKYGPTYPERFESFEHAQTWCAGFFRWYNEHHYHSGIGLLRPVDLYQGRGEERRAAPRQVLRAAYAAHPERFVNGTPEPPAIPSYAAINPPLAEVN